MDARFREIQNEVIAAINQVTSMPAAEVLTTSEQTLNSVNSASKVSTWRLWVWIFSYVFRSHEKLVIKNAENSRPQNLPNYRNMVLSFVDGVPLIHDGNQFIFDLTGITDLEERKKVKQCAVLESNLGILIKVATVVDGIFQPLPNEVADRLLVFVNQQTQPGVGVRMINEVADKLRLNLTVYVDPLVIDLNTGKQLNISGDIYPVKDAINSYLAALEFNGGFVRNFFSKTIENADGVKLLTINLLQWKYASLPYQDLGIYQVPYSGYFKIDDIDLTINYLSYASLE